VIVWRNLPGVVYGEAGGVVVGAAGISLARWVVRCGLVWGGKSGRGAGESSDPFLGRGIEKNKKSGHNKGCV